MTLTGMSGIGKCCAGLGIVTCGADVCTFDSMFPPNQFDFGFPVNDLQ